jgi:type II pantothenate kinase
MLPLARELLRCGSEVVLAANALPAINDITADELRTLIGQAAAVDPVIQAAWQAGSGSSDAAASPPPLPGLQRRVPSSGRLAELGASAAAAATSLHMAMSSSPPSGSPPRGALGASGMQQRRRPREAAGSGSGSPQHGVVWSPDSLPHARSSPQRSAAASHVQKSGSSNGSPDADSSRAATAQQPAEDKECHAAPGSSDTSSTAAPPSQHSRSRAAPLFVVATGQGSPCLDLRRVSAAVADATVGTDLVIIEGMGRAVHTNLHAAFKCNALKLAMIKNEHLAQRLFNGSVYDCICVFEPGIRL